MLSPLPKSTVIWPGMPRKACMTRRWIRSLTGQILEQLTDCQRSVAVFSGQDFLETLEEIRRQIIERFQNGPNELLCVGTVHGGHLRAKRRDEKCPEKRMRNPRGASTALLVRRSWTGARSRRRSGAIEPLRTSFFAAFS